MTTSSLEMTLEEYLNYDDETSDRYELVNGELVTMPPESRPLAGVIETEQARSCRVLQSG